MDNEHPVADAPASASRDPSTWPAWAKPSSNRMVDVGWLLETDQARFVWGEPRRIVRSDPPPAHAKAVSYCPAVVDHEGRMFDIPCPIDLKLGFRKDKEGKATLVNLDGDQSSIRNKTLNSMVSLVGQKEWRHPERPILQLITPYIFLSDEPVYMTQLPPMTHYRPDPWPGQLIAGRLPIHIWPRRMMWAFEWYEPGKPLVLRRGEPWFHVRFETHDPSRPVRMFEAELTPDLKEYLEGIRGVANYVDRTYSLFKVAEERRPATLLKRKARGAAAEQVTPDLR
ncbi:hypothetical protein [Flavisphingomonas formosensis]|uniref:hypothetical protein n=1 Tax=Flavisphingomonas formosensis TaxID=861534 RepID=UPI0018E020CF|nr:hypothetical protein [Sphingomonas formosensis]